MPKRWKSCIIAAKEVAVEAIIAIIALVAALIIPHSTQEKAQINEALLKQQLKNVKTVEKKAPEANSGAGYFGA